MTVSLTTPRLSIGELSTHDAEFIFKLLSEEQFKQNIGDRGVYDLESAKKYIADGPQLSYQSHGFGLFKITLKQTDIPIGMCGLIKRAGLDAPDIGFALLSQYCRRGYTYEASQAILTFAKQTLKLERVLAITNINNQASKNLLSKLGLTLIKELQLPEIEDTQLLYSIHLTIK